MSDVFANAEVELGDPCGDAFAVTPNDSVDLTSTPRALWVGTEGDLVVTMISGSQVTIPAARGLMPIRVTRVHATGTTATGIVGLL